MFETDRRRSRRFPLQCDLRYRTLDKRKPISTGSGKTLNISSSGIGFTSEQEFPVGTRLELSIHWPVKRNDAFPLILIVLGRVTRHNAQQLAVVIYRYQFRLRKMEENNCLRSDPGRVPVNSLSGSSCS